MLMIGHFSFLFFPLNRSDARAPVNAAHPWLRDNNRPIPLDILIYKLVKSYLQATPFKRVALKVPFLSFLLSYAYADICSQSQILPLAHFGVLHLICCDIQCSPCFFIFFNPLACDCVLRFFRFDRC